MIKNILCVFTFVLFAYSAYATDIMCESGKDNFYAEYTPKLLQCANGYYLPANSASCVQCINNYNCSGGEYYFNETQNQGIDYNHIVKGFNVCAVNFPSNLYAVYELTRINCAPGYYLGADDTECTICPLNHYCVGGTYTFNETNDQGIVACANGTFAPTGSSICYEHKLHVGNEALYLRASKRTTPSLNVGYGNEVFYANMTTTPTYMTAGSSHYFKTIYNDTVYYICDDTTYNVEN